MTASMPTTNRQNAARSIRWRLDSFINGRDYQSSSLELINKVNPATEKVICEFPVGGIEDVRVAVENARNRFEDGCWSGMPPGRRVNILAKFAELIASNHSELALLDTVEMGKPITASLFDAGSSAPDRLRLWAGFADKLFGSSAPVGIDSITLNVYEPRGVVGAITSWNFPTLNAIYKIGPALAAGNSLVLKPSEYSSQSALRLAELALEAGVPEGVLNVVLGLGSTVGESLASHADVDILSFTGSTATGRRIMAASAQSNGKPLILECGGKSPQIVFDDIDNLEAVADAAVTWAFTNQGQVCVAHSRVLVHESLKDHLLSQIVTRARRIKPGDPLDEETTFGPLANPAQRARVERYIKQGVTDGAIPVLMGTIQMADGCFVSPTVFDSVFSDMSIVREEIFGPVLCIQGFRTEAEAVALANSTPYGLAATVWTRNLGRAQRMARAIRAGSVIIRTSGKEASGQSIILGREPQKASGFGAELGLQGLESYSTLKAITISGA